VLDAADEVDRPVDGVHVPDEGGARVRLRPEAGPGLGGLRQQLLDLPAALDVRERASGGALLTHHRVAGPADDQVVADQGLDLRVRGGHEVIAAVLRIDGRGGEPVRPGQHALGGDEGGLPRDVQDGICEEWDHALIVARPVRRWPHKPVRAHRRTRLRPAERTPPAD
jgi:hypothetical protein